MRKVSRKLKENKEDNISEYKHELTVEEINEINDTELEENSKGKIIKKMIILCENGIVKIFNTAIIILKGFGIYLVWILLHYFSSHLYIKFCVPNTLLGFIMSPFMISTPHCQGLRWVVYNAANIINNMWILIGAWIYSILWITSINDPPK